MQMGDNHRCAWRALRQTSPDYHDTNGAFLLMMIAVCFLKSSGLETFQSGLSWRTILTKRENFSVVPSSILTQQSPR